MPHVEWSPERPEWEYDIEHTISTTSYGISIAVLSVLLTYSIFLEVVEPGAMKDKIPLLPLISKHALIEITSNHSSHEYH